MRDLKDQRIRCREERVINMIQFIAGIFVGLAISTLIGMLVIMAADIKAEMEDKRNDGK